MKQTAVEWLAEQFDNIVELYPSQTEQINNAIDQAKAMEKEQIIEAHNSGYSEGIYQSCESGEEYYNENFKSE